MFATNSNKTEEAGRAIGAFRQSWTALAAANPAAPPQYADDAAYAGTMAKVAAIADKAAGEIGAGKLTEAHETLEAIRGEIGGLHERNGIVGFSDRMNAYHAEMETVLGLAAKLDAAALPEVAGRVAILSYLADEALRRPPAEAASDPSFAALSADLRQSLDKAKAALATADVAAVKAALGGLKAPYSKLFLKFG